jgi:SAM-dependent methyltransferase
MTPVRKDLHEQNRRSWNLATAAHNSHKRDQAKFLREGGTTLYPEELSLLGDVRGKKLAHLQCNAGQDTLSLAALGAIVTGIDISDEAISFARKLSTDSGIPGTFVRSDIYDWFDAAEPGSFDILFCSYGALLWLSDLTHWGRGIARALSPGGRFVVVDAHPFMMVLGEELELKYAYSGGAPVHDTGIHDYVAQAGEALAPSGFEEGVKDFKNTEPDTSFQWGMGDILTALIEPGLVLERFVEYPFTKWKAFHKAIPGTNGNFVLPPEIPQIPMMFGLVATKR